MEVDLAVDEVDEPVDTLVVAGGFGFDSATEPELIGAIAEHARWARRVCSVCSGAFLLASAGLLNGKTATTHWMACAELARRYPEITVEPDKIFVRDGEIYASAGVTAGIDLALTLVEADHGTEPARNVARALVVYLQRSGGQSQFSARLDHAVSSDSALRPVVDAIDDDPAANHSMSSLAERGHMSERHFARLFHAETGVSPGKYVERARVDAAIELLERTVLTVEKVAKRSGFGTAETMRRAFLRILNVTPSDYLDRFQSTSSQEIF